MRTPRTIEVEIVGDATKLRQALDEAGMKAASFSTLFHLRQALHNLQTEIEMAPPFGADNEIRRAELDQLRDMIERRT